MKNYVLYHGNCYDGFGAAFAAWLRMGDDAEYIPAFYGQPPPEMEHGSNVWILDFSYSVSTILAMCQDHTQVRVYDHHATARTELSSLQLKEPHKIVFDMSKSGAVLACEAFLGDHVKCEVGQLGEFFAYLQDRDLWAFKLPNSREVSAALRAYPFDFKVWEEKTGISRFGQIYEMPGLCIDVLKKEGATCLRLTSQMVQEMCKNARMVEFRDCCDSSWQIEWAKASLPHSTQLGWVVPCANATSAFSEVGEALLNKFPEATFSAYYLDRADGNRQWGLRSRPDFDCSKVARNFGGGGHKQSAGFITKTPNP